MSRNYLKAENKEQGAAVVGDTTEWKLEDLKLSGLEKAELDDWFTLLWKSYAMMKGCQQKPNSV